MEFELKFSMDNAAFEEAPLEECARILREIAGKLSRGDNAGTCRDANGNKVGEWGVG